MTGMAQTILRIQKSEEVVIAFSVRHVNGQWRSWSYRHKWGATAIVSAFTFISPVSSSMIAPAGAAVAHEFGVESPVVIAMITSSFVLAYGASTQSACSGVSFSLGVVAVGPLLLGPLSEIYGRSRVLQAANMWYLGEPLASLTLFLSADDFQSGTSRVALLKTCRK